MKLTKAQQENLEIIKNGGGAVVCYFDGVNKKYQLPDGTPVKKSITEGLIRDKVLVPYGIPLVPGISPCYVLSTEMIR